MTIGPDLRNQIEGLQDAGYSTEPREHETMICGCGYSGQPAHVLRFSVVEEIESNHDLFVCPECGSA